MRSFVLAPLIALVRLTEEMRESSPFRVAVHIDVCHLLQGRIFGETFPLAAAGAGGLPTDALVPGIAVFSRRAEALAAWTSGVELASVSADTDRACLILETGVNERFRCYTSARSVRYLGIQPLEHVTTAAAS